MVIYSLFQELARRDGLSIALSGRNEEELRPVLEYLRFQVLQPKYASFMLDILEMVVGECHGVCLCPARGGWACTLFVYT